MMSLQIRAMAELLLCHPGQSSTGFICSIKHTTPHESPTQVTLMRYLWLFTRSTPMACGFRQVTIGAPEQAHGQRRRMWITT